jgi:hypothetical protein
MSSNANLSSTSRFFIVHMLADFDRVVDSLVVMLQRVNQAFRVPLFLWDVKR